MMKPSAQNRTETDAAILTPSADVFEGKGVEDGMLVAKGRRFFAFDHDEYPADGGILVYYKGMRYPKKGFPTPEAVRANDVLKRIYAAMLSIVGAKDMLLPMLGLAVLPWKFKKRIITRTIFNVNRIGDWMLRGYFLTDNRYCKASRAVRILVRNLVYEIDPKMPAKEVQEFAKITATIFEYDDAYRYRLQDIMTEANRQMLIWAPRQEILRLFDLYLARETADRLKDTIRPLRRLISLALRYKRVQRAISRAVAAMNEEEFEMFKLDNGDRYQVLIRGDYNFLGLTFEERKNIYIDAHTFSKCCRSPVLERQVENISGVQWEPFCKQCKKLCDWTQEFPEEIEVA